MPAYPWLFKNDLDIKGTPSKIRAMQTLGVPYKYQYDMQSVNDLKLQAKDIVANLQADDDVRKMIQSEDIKNLESKEIIALIAYLQRLGTDIKNTGIAIK